MQNIAKKDPVNVIYVRSCADNEDERIINIASQLNGLILTARSKKINIDEVLIEMGSATGSRSRPVFRDLLDRIDMNEISCVLATSYDHLACDYKDGKALDDSLGIGHFNRIVTLDGVYIQESYKKTWRLTRGLRNLYRDFCREFERRVLAKCARF